MAAARDTFVSNLGWLSEEEHSQAMALAWAAPGAVGVNAQVRMGQVMRGWPGALAMLLGSVIPPTAAVGLLAAFADRLPREALNSTGSLLLVPVLAVILCALLEMARQHCRSLAAAGVASVTTITLLVAPSAITPLIVVGVAGLLYGLGGAQGLAHVGSSSSPRWWALLGVLGGTTLTFVMLGAVLPAELNQLIQAMAPLGLSMFGGGMVAIGLLQHLFVSHTHWVSLDDFSLALATSQVAPGPLLSSVAYLGYKVAGVGGALVSAVSIFVPPAVMLCVLSAPLIRWMNNPRARAAMAGVSVTAVGFTGFAFASLSRVLPLTAGHLTVLGACVTLLFFKKAKPWQLALSAIVFSIINLYL